MVQIPSPRGKKRGSNAPRISSEILLLKDKFRRQSNTLHNFQREMRRDDTLRLLLKTFFKELFTNKGEILSCNAPINSKLQHPPPGHTPGI